MVDKQKLVILKIGTSSITATGTGVRLQVINDIAHSLSRYKDAGWNVVIVSSGAMGLGIKELGLKPSLNENISIKQALAAIGQIKLVAAYGDIFKYYGYSVGQILVTHTGLDDSHRNETIKITAENLFKLGVIPIVNANDAVTPKELEYGDNDSLTARMAVLLQADKVIIITDSAGLYEENPKINPSAKRIKEVTNIEAIKKYIGADNLAGIGSGGMTSKIAAAEVLAQNGIDMHLIGINDINRISYLDITDNSDEVQESDFGTIFRAD